MKKIIVALCTLPLSFNSIGQAGSLDTTFGVNGISINCFETIRKTNSSLLQVDGKIIISGTVYGSVIFASRYQMDGSLDLSFGNNGLVDLYSNTTDEVNIWCYDNALQTDGKIILVGWFINSLGSHNFMIARLNIDGSLDATFGSNGKLNLDLGTSFDQAWAAAVQPDGKILVGGTTGSLNGGFATVRLQSDGSLDTTFGNGGKVVTLFSEGSESIINDIEIQSDGKIVVAGNRVNGTRNFALARYTIDGVLDSTFGNDGKVETIYNFGISDQLESIKIQPDGKIIVVGNINYLGSLSETGLILVRYNSNGTIDSTFGNNGFSDIIYATAGYDIELQVDDKILVSGASEAGYFLTPIARICSMVDSAELHSVPTKLISIARICSMVDSEQLHSVPTKLLK